MAVVEGMQAVGMQLGATWVDILQVCIALLLDLQIYQDQAMLEQVAQEIDPTWAEMGTEYAMAIHIGRIIMAKDGAILMDMDGVIIDLTLAGGTADGAFGGLAHGCHGIAGAVCMATDGVGIIAWNIQH